MNKAILVGNLTRDPEVRNTASGISCVTFTVACQRKFANPQGVREADFINCVAWRQTADFVARYFAKGSSIGVEGTIQTRTYDAQDGTKRYVTEVIVDSVEFVGSRGHQQSEANYTAPAPTGYSQPAPASTGGFEEVEDNELPF